MGFAGYLEDIQDQQKGDWRRTPRAVSPERQGISSKSQPEPPPSRFCPTCETILGPNEVHRTCLPQAFFLVLDSERVFDRQISIWPKAFRTISVSSGPGNLTVKQVGRDHAEHILETMGGLQVVTEYFQATEFSAVEIGYQGQSIHACLLHSVTEGAELRKLFNTYNAICLNGGARVEATIKELEDQQKKLSRRTRDVGRKFISYFKGALYDSSNV